MDAEREAREIVNDYRGYPDWWEQQRCYDTLELRIAAALRRAHAAGRREAVEECAEHVGKLVLLTPTEKRMVQSSIRRALAAGAGEQKEGEG